MNLSGRERMAHFLGSLLVLWNSIVLQVALVVMSGTGRTLKEMV